MHRALVVHNRYAWRSYRTKAAFDGEQGLLLLTIEQLAARLAGGFLEPIDSDQLKIAVAAAIAEPLGELDAIKALPGFQRAAAASLSKAWGAGLTLQEEAEAAADETAKARLASLAALEREVLSRLPNNQVRPRDLVAAASDRVAHARAIFGRIQIHGRTEMSPVWRPLLSLIAQHTDVVWVGEAREIPGWLSDAKIAVETSPRSEPAVRAVSCASPHHEILEAFRWARQHLAQGALPQQVAIATASPETWDDHVLALAEVANLPLHFIHGRAVLSTAEGQLAAALAEILLRGFSRTRIIRFVAMLRIQCKRFESFPGDWWRALPEDAPLLDATRWSGAIGVLAPESFSDGKDHRPLLEEIIETLHKGLSEAAGIGEGLLDGRSLSVWRKALTEGPPAALDVTLNGLRVDDGVEPGAAIVWGPASAIAAVPRPFTWLVGLSSRSWPRRAGEDPLLPEHIIAAGRLDPLPVHKADRRDFQTICTMTESEVVCSRARRDSGGRLNGVSPLYPHHLGEAYLAQSREAGRRDDEVLLQAVDGDARLELRLRRLGRRRPANVARRLDELVERYVLDEVWSVHREILSATGRQEPLSRLSIPSRNSRPPSRSRCSGADRHPNPQPEWAEPTFPALPRRGAAKRDHGGSESARTRPALANSQAGRRGREPIGAGCSGATYRGQASL